MWKTCVTLALLMCIQVCAHVPLYPRVVAGANAQKKAWPWIVSLHNPTCHFCGGSLISRQWVLTAAHCFIGSGYIVTEDTVHVYLGKMTQRGKNKKEKMLNVQKIYTHSAYNPATFDNDIALLHLSSPVKFNDHISPLCLLASGSHFSPGTSSRIIGWGKIADQKNVPYPGTLQEATVSVVDHNQCRNNLQQCILFLNQHGIMLNAQVTNNMICAGVPTGDVDAHKGDSGGPMMSQHCSKWVQSGITSWGLNDCGRINVPGVYTRVSQYQQWITHIIQNHPSQDLPQFVDINLPCSSSGKPNSKKKWSCFL